MPSQRLILTHISVFILLCLTAQAAWAVDFHFSWLPNSEPNVAGYRMYYGLSSRNYSGYIEVDAVPDPETGRMHGIIHDLSDQEVYFFAATAFTDDNMESDFSTEITASSQPPDITLTSPADGSFYAMGETVEFAASVVDINGSDISAELKWESDINGYIGTGPSLSSSALSAGTHYITASVTDTSGQVQEKSILITIDYPTNLIDFSRTNTVSYYTSQDGNGTVTVEDNGATIALAGNRWIKTEQLYDITADTILEFDFNSTTEGEIHGIGFDEDDNPYNNQRIFQIFGSQFWDNLIRVSPQYSNCDTGNWVHFSIAVGQSYTGNNMHMVFINDDDRDPATGTGSFRNIKMYQAVTKILGDCLNADYNGTVSETFTNLNDLVNEGAEHISTWSWSTPAPHKVANTIILKTDLADIPPNAYISEARVYLYQIEAFGAAEYNNSVHKIIGANPIIAQVSGYNAQDNRPWTRVPDGTSYNNIPMGLGDIDQAEDTVLLDTTTGYQWWTITDMVQDWVNNPDTNYGLLIQGEPTAVETGRIFTASENQNEAIRPFIVIRYSVGM